MLQICNTGLTGCNEGLQQKKKKTKFIHTKINDFNGNRICKYHITKLLFISYISTHFVVVTINNN